MPSVNAGRINEVTPSLPLTGNQPSQSEKVKINSGPITKLGTETPSTAVIIENLSKIQRLNLELQTLDKENTRTQEEIENIKKSLTTLDEDVSREKGIIYSINLDKRTDRWDEMKKTFYIEHFKLHRISAVDGKLLFVGSLLVGGNI